jgi:hypothetical protein
MFAHEIEKPIVGMYVIFSLTKQFALDQLRDVSAVFEITDTINQQKPSLFFGVHFDTEAGFGWGPGVQVNPSSIGGVRCKMWSYPRSATPDTVPQILALQAI